MFAGESSMRDDDDFGNSILVVESNGHSCRTSIQRHIFNPLSDWGLENDAVDCVEERKNGKLKRYITKRKGRCPWVPAENL